MVKRASATKCLIASLLLSTVFAAQFFKAVTDAEQSNVDQSDAIAQEPIDRVIQLPRKKSGEEHMKEMTEAIKESREREARGENTQPIYTCESREDETAADTGSDFLKFMPVFVGEVTQDDPEIYSAGGRCFQSISVSYIPVNETFFFVTVTTAYPREYFLKPCKERLIIANTEIFHEEIFSRARTHNLLFQMDTAAEQENMAFGGIKVFLLCESMTAETKSFIATMNAFTDGGSESITVSEETTAANLAFIEEAMYWQLPERETQNLDIDEDSINSGDLFGVLRLDGTGTMAMYGSGSRLTHSTMALRFDDGLYIVESQGGSWWPVSGIQCTPYQEWIQRARDSDMHVIHLRLKPEIATEFDEEAARAFFDRTAGLPYGYHNSIFGWIDTATDNWPPLLPQEIVPIAASVYQITNPEKADVLFGQALNLRMGTQGQNMTALASLAADQGMSLNDVMAMPEQDGWVYSGIGSTDGESYDCSAYVTAMYKHAGLFGEFEINSTEFTTRDVYLLDFFDKTSPLPEQCIAADPSLPYCQLAGQYQVDIGEEYATVEASNLMSQDCPTVNPDYLRPLNC